MTRIARVRIGLMALMVAATCFLAVATTALAQPGDSVENATYLNDYLASSLTTGLVPATFGTGSYYFKVLLSSGSALHADFASGAGVNGLKAILIDQSSSKTDFVESVVVSPSLCRLTFTAPAKGMYTIYVPSNTLGTFTVSPTVSSAPVVTPGTLSGTVSYSGGALSGATASVAGYAAATTASNGTYAIAGITPGTYTATFYKTGYTTQNLSVTIASGATTTKNVTLVAPTVPVTPQGVYRFRSMTTFGTYLWTNDDSERDTIRNTLTNNWFYEGEAYGINTANTANCDQMWRFKSKTLWTYFYTADPAEMATVKNDPNAIWAYEGPVWKVSRNTQAGKPVWRFRCLKNPTYFWTQDPTEMATIRDTLSSDYVLEGIAYYHGQ